MLVLIIIVVLCVIVLSSLVLMIIRDRSSNLKHKVIILALFILICSIGIIVETYYGNLGYSNYEIGEMTAGYIFGVAFPITLVATIFFKVKNYINSKKND